jgi:hypothetical protein
MVAISSQNGIQTSKRKDETPSISPNTIKKRRVLEERSSNIKPQAPSRKMASQPKSTFEEDLDRLTQEIGEIGDSISSERVDIVPFETDQKWSRPAVREFNPDKDALSMSLVRLWLM